MKKISINSTIRLLVIVLLGLTFLFNIGEVWMLITNQLGPGVKRQLHTPIHIKLIKDIFFISIISLGLLKMLLLKRVPKDRYYYLLLACVGLSFLLSVFRQDILVTLSGVRFFLPLLLFPALYDTIDEAFQNKLSKVLIFLFLLNFILQIYQFESRAVLGNRRNPGMFATPSTTAFFSLIVIYYIYHFNKNRTLAKILAYILGPLTVFLTGSGTGIICLLLFFVILAYFKISRKWLLGFVCVPVIAILAILPEMVSRKNIYKSPHVRLRLFKDAMRQDDLLLSTNFGTGTNTANMLKRTYDRGPDKVHADSTITAMLTSFGAIPFVALLLFMAKNLRYRMCHCHFLCVFGIFAIMTVIFESFPANLLFIVNLSYFHNQKQESIKTLAEHAPIGDTEFQK